MTCMSLRAASPMRAGLAHRALEPRVQRVVRVLEGSRYLQRHGDLRLPLSSIVRERGAGAKLIYLKAERAGARPRRPARSDIIHRFFRHFQEFSACSSPPHFAQAPTAGGDAGLMSFLPIILMFVLLYFLMIRPQMKRAKEHKAMVDALQKGDEVVAVGGLLGKIVELSDQYATARDRAETPRSWCSGRRCRRCCPRARSRPHQVE